jgi:hypothetical protein
LLFEVHSSPNLDSCRNSRHAGRSPPRAGEDRPACDCGSYANPRHAGDRDRCLASLLLADLRAQRRRPRVIGRARWPRRRRPRPGEAPILDDEEQGEGGETSATGPTGSKAPPAPAAAPSRSGCGRAPEGHRHHEGQGRPTKPRGARCG